MVAVWDDCVWTRNCPELSDEEFVRMGIGRCLGDSTSGRGFLQQWAMEEGKAVQVPHFFETLKSQRRLSMVKDLNERVARRMKPAAHNGLDEIEALSKFDVYAGDGHYHKASVHERPVGGQRWAVAHFYALNLRTHAVTHLTGQDLRGGRKKEHDMHALKRLSPAQLRQGAPKGRKVLYAWDNAVIDLKQWYQWKQGSGIYILTRLKDNMKYEIYDERPIDPEDPHNIGVFTDALIATATSGYLLRLIRYHCPVNDTVFEFLTNEMTLSAGVLAYLYKRRWDIEKTYDSFKNKLGQTKAWARSRTAQALQANLLCLTHNLIVSLLRQIETSEDLVDPTPRQKAEKRLNRVLQRLDSARKQLAPLYQNTARRSQICLRFLRWLRHHLRARTSLNDTLHNLRTIYALY